MYSLLVEPVDTVITPPHKDLARVLDTALSFEPASAGYTRNVFWDGKIHLFNVRKSSFPTGLLVRVCHLLKEFGYEYQINNQLPKIEPNANFQFTGQLRGYQEEDLKKLDIKNKKRGVVWAVTGAGKSIYLMKTIEEIQVKPVLILVDTRDLLYQMADFTKRLLGIEPGLFGSGFKDLSKDITIAIIDSVWESLGKKNSEKTTFDWQVCDYIHKIPVVMTDECQNVPAKSFYSVHRQMYNAIYKTGLSGTPWRTDGYTLYIEAAIGPILVQRPAQDLIKEGYLARPKILALPVKKINDRSWNWGRVSDDYQSIYSECIVQNTFRNGLIEQILSFKQNLPALILVQRIEHGHILHKTLESKGLKVHYLKGEDFDIIRQQTFNDYRNNKIDVLIMTQIGNVGIDLPNIRCLIIAGAGKSSVLTYQRVGRALRACPGKTEVLIVDFRDYVKYLRGHSDERIRLYKAVGYETAVLSDIDEIQTHLHPRNTSQSNTPAMS
jgi:superfamily II DNA or RNA helicase